MWTTLCVNLSEILEVRGSNLTEDEAWVLLYEIGRQLKNVPSEACQDHVIVPENIQLYRNGGLSVQFSPSDDKPFPGVAQVVAANENVLVYSLGMTLLCCLQKYVPIGRYLDISEELQSVLAAMASTRSSLRELEQVIAEHKFYCENWENKVSQCLKSMYRSIFGSISEMPIEQQSHGMAEKVFVGLSPIERIPDAHVIEESAQQLDSMLPPLHRASVDQHMPDCEDEHYEDERFWDDVDSSVSPRDKEVFESLSNSEFESESYRKKVPAATSMLHRQHSPTQLSLTLKRSNFKNISQVFVEYLDGRNLKVNMEMDRISCGHLLTIVVSHFKIDPSVYCLTVLKDDEYFVMDPALSINEAAVRCSTLSEVRFHLQLRFLPQDCNTIRDSKLLHAMYLQTRRDILNGVITCTVEEAMLLSAYALQYEFGDIQLSPKTFKIRDFVPVSIIEKHTASHLRTFLSRLHASMRGTQKPAARNLFLRKATELPDFGNHLMRISLARKCQKSAYAWLTAGPRGLKLFQVSSSSRTTLHCFSWDDLIKVSYKKTLVVVVAKSDRRLKLYVENAHRAKYIVGIIGKTHQFYRSTDFQSVDQFYYPRAVGSPSQPVFALPFVRRNPPPPRGSEDSRALVGVSVLGTGPGPQGVAQPESIEESVSSGHPQITPFQDEVENNRSDIEGNVEDFDIEPGPVAVQSHEDIDVASSQVGVSVHGEDAANAPEYAFDPRDIPSPRYDSFPKQRFQHDIGYPAVVSMVDSAVEEFTVAGSFAETDRSSNHHDIPVFMIGDEAAPDDFEVSQIVPASQMPILEVNLTSGNISSPQRLTGVCSIPSEERRHATSREETASRGEGDGISNFSGPDQQLDLSKSVKPPSKPTRSAQEAIPEAATAAIADFEEFKRRLSRLKSANESSDSGGDNSNINHSGHRE